MRRTIVGLLMTLWVSPAFGQVLRVAELSAEQLGRLDRAKTAVLLPGGILEEHGPYLPSYSDGYLNERLTQGLADAIAARPGWRALVFPPIPLGNSGANDIGGRFSFPGTYAVRYETLRAVFMDLADELRAQGFRWIFAVHLHGAPNHSRFARRGRRLLPRLLRRPHGPSRRRRVGLREDRGSEAAGDRRRGGPADPRGHGRDELDALPPAGPRARRPSRCAGARG